MTPASTNTIALLLPLSGPAAVFSQAIEKGFDDARNGVISQVTASAVVPSSTPAAAAVTGATAPAASTVTGSANAPISATSPANTDAVVSPSAATIPAATPPASAAVTAAASSAPTIPATAPANSTTLVKVYDTNTQPVEQLIKQAQSDGATLVVGPLLKDDVSKVASLSTPLNILALNEPGSLQNHPNMCYFALSPENEARDAARHIWQQNKRMPLLLIPANNFGNRVANALRLSGKNWGAQWSNSRRLVQSLILNNGLTVIPVSQ